MIHLVYCSSPPQSSVEVGFFIFLVSCSIPIHWNRLAHSICFLNITYEQRVASYSCSDTDPATYWQLESQTRSSLGRIWHALRPLGPQATPVLTDYLSISPTCPSSVATSHVFLRKKVYLYSKDDFKSRFVVAEWEGGEDWGSGVSRCKQLHLGQINKVLLHSTGTASNFLGSTRVEKNIEKECKYVCNRVTLLYSRN